MADLLNTASIMMCPHGGIVSAISQNTNVMAVGAPLVRASDTFLIAGCSLTSLVPPSPCVQVMWVLANAKSQVAGDFTLSESSVGLCLAGTMVPQGTVLIVSTQPEVSGL